VTILRALPTANHGGADGQAGPSGSHLGRFEEVPWSSSVGIQIDRIWRYRWLVVAITVISMVAGVVAAWSARAEYTGQAVLSAASPTKSSDDPTLAQGYVSIFNEPAYQRSLSQHAKVTGNVTSYGARTAGYGPVFYITATSTSADAASSAAAAMAQAYADELNSQLKARRDQAIANMTNDFRKTWGERLGNDDPAALAAQDQLQQQINDVNADRANEVTVLALDAGVSVEGSGRVQTLGFVLLGGLLLGCVVAVVASISSRRLVTDYDVAEKLGVTLLDVLPSPTDDRHSGSRGVRLRHLVNVLVQRQADQPSAIAVASAAGGDAAREIAEAIATSRAAQGAATVLIYADLHRADDEAPGLAELLDVNHSADVEDVLNNRSDSLEIIPTGMSSSDPFVLFDRQRISAVVEKLRERASFIVIESPALPRFGEAQVISDATDGTLLIIEQGTRLDDAREALRVLDQIGATLIGAVLAEGDSRSSILRRATRSASVARENEDRTTADSGHIDRQVVTTAPPPTQQTT
jgi:succinoglycan biosynthesis transport protein ExoP